MKRFLKFAAHYTVSNYSKEKIASIALQPRLMKLNLKWHSDKKKVIKIWAAYRKCNQKISSWAFTF